MFEHIPDPTAAIISAENVLADGGIVVLNLPSSRGALFKVAVVLNRVGWSGPYDRLWQKGLSSPHLSYFNGSNLVAFVQRHTALRVVDKSSLRSVSRAGLRERIKVTIPSRHGDVLFVAVWLASFALAMLPSDIALVMFRKDTSAQPARSPGKEPNGGADPGR